jgi:serine/threonine protein kinase/tetratricopeptide (TPR) repeat protein
MNLRQENEEAIFDEARRIADPAGRAAFLDRSCNGDTALRERLAELLKLEPQAEIFFSGVVENISAGNLAEISSEASSVLDEQIGTVIGRYKLLEKIGEGGCGVVYMAEQQKPVRRRVALKIIKLGMDTKSVIARFEAERQALAMMEHPNIARVLDAGATEIGRPFFVMELVRGFKITEYCDKNNLPMPQRLDLFIQVCHAIQHAHQKGLIHRDIKPSNILVTLHDGVPVPKVIDFGIAKAIDEPLTDKTLFTSYAQLIGTPAYMSPEQAEMSGLDIDTRSDVYSLGVLLYELLTGRTPFDGQALVKSGVDNLRRTLREQEPARPSTMVTTMQGNELLATAERRRSEPVKLITALSGDLDWIVMKALEKDRQRRYQTANGMAMEVQRYLANEPVLARPPGRFYRLQKLVRRNKIIFAAGTAITAALIIGLGISMIMFFREREARKIADDATRRETQLREAAEQGRKNEMLLRQEAESREKVVQAAMLLRRNNYTEADVLIAALPPNQQNLAGASVFRSLGEWHALRGEWPAAAERFAVLLRINEPDEIYSASMDFSMQTPVLVRLGNLAAYHQLRAEMVRRFADVSDPQVAERVLKNSLLAEPDPEVIRTLTPIANYITTYVNGMSAEYPNKTCWQNLALGLYHLRQEGYAKAADCCRKCLTYTGPEGLDSPRRAAAQLILAMAEFHLNQTEAAQESLETGKRLVDTKLNSSLNRGNGVSGYWFDWMFASALLNEAETLVATAR